MAVMGPCEPWVTQKPPFTQGCVGPPPWCPHRRDPEARVFWAGPLPGPSVTAGPPSQLRGVPAWAPLWRRSAGQSRCTHSLGLGWEAGVRCFTAFTPGPGSPCGPSRARGLNWPQWSAACPWPCRRASGLAVLRYPGTPPSSILSRHRFHQPACTVWSASLGWLSCAVLLLLEPCRTPPEVPGAPCVLMT